MAEQAIVNRWRPVRPAGGTALAVILAMSSQPVLALSLSCSDLQQSFTTSAAPGTTSGTIQSFAVPANKVTIDAAGAQGNGGFGAVGGLGAEVVATFPITTGETLCVLVGVQGGVALNGGGGGGGGSFVYGISSGTCGSNLAAVRTGAASPNLLVVAGGGGGGSSDGVAGLGGLAPTGAGTQFGGAGGTNGGGGGAVLNAGGGGGLLTNGGTANGVPGGLALINGGTGGTLPTFANGGYGGGGAGAGTGGGGGGYNGGGAGGSNVLIGSGGGGGSFSATAPLSALSGVNAGNGAVLFCYLESPGPTATIIINLGNLGNLGQTPGLPRNQASVANALDRAFNNGGSFPGAFQQLGFLSAQQLVNAVLQLDGEVGTNAEKGSFQLMNQFLGLMLDPFVDGRFGVGTSSFAQDRETALPPDIATAYASVMKAPPKVIDNSWSVWGTSFGGTSHANGDPAIGSNNVTANIYGFASGADYHLTRNTLAGFALAGAGTNWGLAQSVGSGRSDAFQAGIYGKTAWGPVYLAAALAYTENWFTTNRSALGDQLTAKFNGQSYGGRLESGYRFIVLSRAGQWEIAPYGAIQAQSFHTPTYSETDLTGGGLGLNVNAMNASDTRGELGGRFADMIAVNGMPLILRARFAWAHDWVDNPTLNAAFQSLPGASFVVNGAPIPCDSALASVGAELHMTTHWSALTKFDGEFARNSQTYAGTGTLRYTW